MCIEKGNKVVVDRFVKLVLQVDFGFKMLLSPPSKIITVIQEDSK